MNFKTIYAFVVSVACGIAPSVSNAEPSHAVMNAANRQILVVMTNHDRYPSRSDSTGLWLTELTKFMDTVEAAGYTTVFVSPKGGKVPLDQRSLGWIHMDSSARKHLDSAAFRDRLERTAAIASVDPTQFAAIYFTGGHGVMWDFPNDQHLQRVAERIYAQGGVISAVCHGVSGLVNLKDGQGQALIKGQNITGFSNREELLSGMKPQVPFLLQDALVAKGALYSQNWIPFTSYVVTDGRIVTGQNPQSPEAVAKAVVSLLNAQTKGQ
jgi:putative intracellular protease/amidase